MVWEAIKRWYHSSHRCPDRVDFVVYENVLKKGLLPKYKAQNMFQQDGDPCHKSRLVSSFLYKSKICVLIDWPGQSPNLNVIDPFLAGLKPRCASCMSDNITILWMTSKDPWVMIPALKIKNMHESNKKGINTSS